MPPSKNNRTISQEAFEGLVKENIEDLDMDPNEALEDAIQTLTLQGVDLSGIVTCIPGVTSLKDNPVIQTLDLLTQVASRLVRLSDDQKANVIDTDVDLDEIIGLLDKLYDLCSVEGSGYSSIAARNGGLELVTSICYALSIGYQQERPLVSALKTISSLLIDVQSTEAFRQGGGPKIVTDILNRYSQDINVLDSGFAVVAAAATGNEVVKELFVELKVDELLIRIMKGQSKGKSQSLYEALRVLLTPDDNRVLASQVYGYARRFAQIGIAEALVDALCEGISSPSLVSASIAMKAIAVNEEICRSIAECGGIDALLQCIDDSGEQNNKGVARASCSLLCKLAGSDANKNAIIQKGGLDKLIKLASRFSEDPSVLQEIMSIICTLSLRSPENAARAIEAGAGDFAIQAMQQFPAASQMQKQSCLMIRNLVVRNPENRTILLSNGIEKIIRKAKENHGSCKDAATAALRDLGLDDYNS
ncbi:ARM repeat superfamily protein [Tasmannia lanceolata]|uniref:ARM repeat superfamily protein n=1 Tax=Tasmannia lanceolata TaxID=3420 RepID=UPI0040641906